jgi:hypothetical protein
VAGRASSRASPLPHGFCGDRKICDRLGSNCGVSQSACDGGGSGDVDVD